MDLRSQLQSTLGDSYIIGRELGGGGMSRVFVAVECALGRKVVIKVLPSETAGALSVERFKREIALAARLQQANIVPVLSAGDMDGRPYFVMPYVEGESLRARLSSGGELPIADAVGILKEVARALAYAHEQGVVHRDIKPDNVLLSGGTAMVTDFGVAKAVSAAASEDGHAMTATGVTVGTPAYMSPEQASADPKVDHRADIYAFGCLAYELLTGSAPFAGRSPQAMISAHLTEEPDPVERRRTTVSWPLAALVARCLAKNPADRPQHASEIAQALDQAISTPTAAAPPRAPSRANRTPMVVALTVIIAVGVVLLLVPLAKWPARATTRSIAVLPFANTTGDSTAAYLAEGLGDELRTLLAGVTGLRVKARSSSMQMSGKGAREAGKTLDVDAVLEGTLSGTPARARVVAELVQVSDESTLWSGAFDLPATGISAFRDSLTRAIVGALRVRIAGTGSAERSATRGTNSDRAYAAFLKGEYYRRRFNYPAALTALEEAVAADPEFARAHAALAIAQATTPMIGTTLSAEALPKAMASIDRATTLSPNLATAQVARGLLLFFGEWRLAEAEAAMRRAVTLDSADTEAHVWHAYLLGALGRVEDATRVVDDALRIEPLSVDLLVVRQASFMLTRKYSAVAEATKPILELDPSNTVAMWNLAEAYMFGGQPDSAVKMADAMMRTGLPGFGARLVLMYTLAGAGRWVEAAEQRRLVEAERTNSPNYYQTVINVVWGNISAADAAFERGVRAREPLFNTVWLGVEPIFYRLHSAPRFTKIMSELGIKVGPVADRWPIPAPPHP